MKTTSAPTSRPSKLLVGVIALSGFLLHIGSSHAEQRWIKDGMTPEKDAQVYLGSEFTETKGTFLVTPESRTNNIDKVEGNFVVGNYRYVYKQASADVTGKNVDEMISTEILDCERKVYGTLSQQWLLKGVQVSEKKTPVEDVTMSRPAKPNVDSKLCALHARKSTKK